MHKTQSGVFGLFRKALSRPGPRAALSAPAIAVFLAIPVPSSAPPLAVTKPATEVGVESATLNGLVKARGAASSYWFEYGLSNKYGASTSAESVGSSKKPEKVSAAVGKLSSGMIYHFRIVATNGRRTRKGHDMTFTTLAGRSEEEGGGAGGEEGGGEGEGAPAWTLQSPPNPDPSRETLETVSCLSSAQCVAVGDGALALSWNGATWSVMPTPSTYGEFDSVSCTSSTACTAVGYLETTPLAMRLEGSEWKLQEPLSQPGAQRTALHGISCTSATFCVAVGDYEDSAGNWYPLAEIWSGAKWEIREMPAVSSWLNYVYGVSCTSVSDCTAVGYTPSGPLAERWDGTGWKAQTVPGGSGFDSVSCLSSSSCLAVGFKPSLNATYAASWDGTEWKTLLTLNPAGAVRAELNSVSCVSAASCTAVGWDETDPGTGTAYTLAEHWDGSAWEIQSTPNPPGSVSSVLQGVSCVAPLLCEAVGRYNAGPILGFAERYE